MRGWQALAIWTAAALGCWPASAQVGSVQSLDIRIPVAPQPVRVGETLHVFYELHLTNYASSAATLTQIAVLDANTSAVLERFEGDTLAALLVLPIVTKDAAPGSIPAGMHGAIYMTLPLDQPLPTKLAHRITLTVPIRNEPRSVTLHSDVLQIDPTPLLELAPPLRGGTWAALYDPTMERGHRRVLYTVDGHAHLPGRFAVDFLGVDANGKIHRGTGERPSDYFGYGADVLAVSDGVIVATRDEFTEPATLAAAPERIPIGDATGVYVTLDIGGGRYAFYEHLQPGLAVKAGQKVRRGERLGKLGFTGQASSPHLHFHVANATAPLAAEGMPYHFTSYRQLGRYNSIMEFGQKPWQPAPAPRVISKSLPGANAVLSFD
jgi:murein DD-endopeptidase